MESLNLKNLQVHFSDGTKVAYTHIGNYEVSENWLRIYDCEGELGYLVKTTDIRIISITEVK